MPPKIKGLSHVTLICKNLNKSAKIFTELFDAIEVYSSEQKNFSISQEKFFLIGDLWIALMEGSPTERAYNHIAFSVDEADFSLLESKIRALELTTLPSRPVTREKENLSTFTTTTITYLNFMPEI